MANVGLKHTYLAVLDKDGKILKGETGLSEDGLYTSNAKDLGTKSANITNLATAGTAVYGDNGQADTTKSKSFPSVAGVWNNLPWDIKSKILGRESDGNGGYVQSMDLPRVALIVESETLDRQNSFFYAFSNGQMIESALNLQSDQNTEQRVDDSLTYQSFGDDRWNGQGIKIFYSGDDEFTKEDMLAEVMGGYVATPGG
ncbi:phage tail protein [Weissella hellenica]|uniref:phage tail protein n=1 Tax=Weissella hellenica TaxID=46256 RepID=UPI00388A03D7